MHAKFGPDRESAHAAGFEVAQWCLRFLVCVSIIIIIVHYIMMLILHWVLCKTVLVWHFKCACII